MKKLLLGIALVCCAASNETSELKKTLLESHDRALRVGAVIGVRIYANHPERYTNINQVADEALRIWYAATNEVEAIRLLTQ